jgi:hypothetical protein
MKRLNAEMPKRLNEEEPLGARSRHAVFIGEGAPGAAIPRFALRVVFLPDLGVSAFRRFGVSCHA